MLLEMLHSCSPMTNKKNTLESVKRERGCIRILVATIAFGIGVDFKQVYRTIHYGPGKNVEAYMQERDRDGKQKNSLLVVSEFSVNTW